jgi:hypothetical protein
MQQPRASSLSTLRVVAIPAIPAFVSLGVTLLRLVGELRDWPKPLVNNDVCGKAILGVVWLVPIFGIYFAVKLFHAGHAPQRFARPMLLAVSALALKLAGTFVMESQEMTYIPRLSTNFIVTLIGLVLSAKAWPSLSKALLVYGYLSRIPIAIVQYLAMRGRWGTHYDALDPGFPSIGFWPTFFRVSFVPNIFFMEVYTVIVGALVGIAAFAVPGLRGLEEVCSDQVLGMVLEKGPPSLRGRFSVPRHIFGNRRLRDCDSNLQQFTVNAWSTPTWVGQAHLTNQFPNFRAYGWAAFAVPTLPSPIEPKPLRCQAMTVSGLTMSSADLQSFHNRESQAHRTRSAERRANRWPPSARCRAKS